MNRNTKKGFTIVELIIVIAVIGILAAVLIPTFSGLIRNSQEAKDTALVRNLNVLLKMDNTKHESMRSVVEALDKQGADITKLTAAITENRILWDSEADLFAYLNKGTDGKETISYIPDFDGTPLESKYKYWIVSDSKADVDSKDYSVYWRGEGMDKLTVYTGFDCGKAKFDKIIYTSDKQQDVSLYINGGDLVVSAVNNGTQHLYGNVVNATIATGNDCLYVHGTIAKATVTAGKVVADGGLVMVAAAASGVTVVGQNGGVVAATADASELPDTVKVSTDAEKSAYALEIGSREDLLAFRDMVNSGVSFAGMTAKLTADIDMTGYKWLTMIGTKEKPFEGTFDGANHKIINLSNGGFKTNLECTNATSGTTGKSFGLFGYVAGNVSVSNLTMENVLANIDNGNGVAGVISNAGNHETSLSMKNVTVSGTIIGGDRVAGLVGYGAGYEAVGTMSFENCTNNAEITGSVTRVAGIVAAQGQQGTKYAYVNCTNNGKITCTGTKYGGVAAGICASLEIKGQYNVDGNVTNIYENTKLGVDFSYQNCINNGEIKAGVAYGLFTSILFTSSNTNYGEDGIDKNDVVMRDSYKVTFVTAYKYGCIGESISPYNWEKLDSNKNYHLLAGIAYGKDKEYVFEYENGSRYTAEEMQVAFSNLGNSSTKQDEHANKMGCLKLLKDYTLEETYDKQTTEINMDLNGYTLTIKTQLLKGDGGVVNIKNGVIAYDASYKGILLYPYGKINLENVTINAEGVDIIKRNNENTTLTITLKSCNINAKIFLNTNATVTINGTEYTGVKGNNTIKISNKDNKTVIDF